MSVVGSQNKTLLDVAKETDPNGVIPDVIEMLSQENQILDDIVWVACNQTTSHKTSIRTGLPKPIWRKMYEGVPPDKSTRATVSDSCGQMEARSEIDKDLAELNGNTNAFRLQEDMSHMEGMSQEFTTQLFYGSEVKRPETFTGFAPRFSDATAPNGCNIIADYQSQSAQNSSIWLIAWDNLTVHGIYPKGHSAGWKHENLGEIDAFDENKNRYRAYASRYTWKCGLAVRDWRYVVRAIFDAKALTKDASSGANLTELMEIMQERIHSLNKGRLAFYMNKQTLEKLRLQLGAQAKYQLTRETIAGKKVTSYGGIPIRVCEAITNTEAKVKTA